MAAERKRRRVSRRAEWADGAGLTGRRFGGGRIGRQVHLGLELLVVDVAVDGHGAGLALGRRPLDAGDVVERGRGRGRSAAADEAHDDGAQDRRTARQQERDAVRAPFLVQNTCRRKDKHE